jgi:hypothetical protein
MARTTCLKRNAAAATLGLTGGGESPRAPRTPRVAGKSKAQLQEICAAAQLEEGGTKADLVARIEAAQLQATAAEQARPQAAAGASMSASSSSSAGVGRGAELEVDAGAGVSAGTEAAPKAGSEAGAEAGAESADPHAQFAVGDGLELLTVAELKAACADKRLFFSKKRKVTKVSLIVLLRASAGAGSGAGAMCHVMRRTSRGRASLLMPALWRLSGRSGEELCMRACVRAERGSRVASRGHPRRPRGPPKPRRRRRRRPRELRRRRRRRRPRCRR